LDPFVVCYLSLAGKTLRHRRLGLFELGGKAEGQPPFVDQSIDRRNQDREMTRRDLYAAIMVGAVEWVRPKMMAVVAITPAVIETRRFLHERSSIGRH
jgi:hypothetical protein